MVSGWRRAFCTTIPKEKVESVSEKQQTSNCQISNSPRISSKFGFFSNTSTPRFRHQQQDPDPAVPSPVLRCRTSSAKKPNSTPTSSSQNSPRDQPNIKRTTLNSPRLLFHYFSSANSNNASNPSSPRSPSTLSLLKSTLRLSRNKCGICAQGMKSGEGTAIFTAECNHAFHLTCLSSHLKSQVIVVSCPVCGCTWREPPLLPSGRATEDQNKKHLRVYDDDEPLMSPSTGSLFVPIPEYDENLQDDDEDGEFQGFFVNTPTPPPPPPPVVRPRINAKVPEVSILPDSALVSVGRDHETRVAVLKVRAPQFASSARAMRQPVDLVALLDVSEGSSPRGLKRAVAVIVSSLGATDRFSVVIFSSASKRLMPLRRMTPAGKRSARHVVDAIDFNGRGMAVGDALKKAAKVIEDRRERNPLAGIVVISSACNRSSTMSTTRISVHSDLHIPVHSVSLGENEPNALSRCVHGILAVMFQEVSLQLRFAPGSAPAEVTGVYPLSGRTGVFGSSSVRVGDMYGGEEREFLVEVKVLAAHAGAHNVLSVRSSYREPATQETVSCKERLILVPRPKPARSTDPMIQRLRNVHVTTRAMAESRRVLELAGDVSGAYHLLSSARALMTQSSDISAGECLRGLEAELAELQRRARVAVRGRVQRNGQQPVAADEKLEPLTPTSAWRAAERLAKVAIMRKHMNRVSDLHGFENARF